MKIDKRSAMVKCPTCNRNECKLVGYGFDAEPDLLWLQFCCWNSQCPAPRFKFMFRIYPQRTVLDVEILEHDAD